MQNDDTIIVKQTIYNDQQLAGYQIFNYNTAIISKVEELCLILAFDDFKLLPKNIITYTHFTKSIQWLKCQTQPNIIYAVAKVNKYNIKYTNECQTPIIYLL